MRVLKTLYGLIVDDRVLAVGALLSIAVAWVFVHLFHFAMLAGFVFAGCLAACLFLSLRKERKRHS